MTRARKPSVTSAELKVVAIVLAQLRRALRLRAQLHVTFDPWLVGDGVTITAGPNAMVKRFEVTGVAKPTKRRKRGGR